MVFLLNSQAMIASNINTVLLLSSLTEEEEHAHSRERRFKEKLVPNDKRKRYRSITGRALQHPTMSTFLVLFGSDWDQSLITTCGLDHTAFRTLLVQLKPFYDIYSQYSEDGRIIHLQHLNNRGRPRSLTAYHCLT